MDVVLAVQIALILVWVSADISDMLRFGIPTAAYHPGSTAEYVMRACSRLGIVADILDQANFESAFTAGSYDYFLCVDSGAPLSFARAAFAGKDLSRVALWSIDFRHNKDRPTRVPTDREMVATLHAQGGTVYQAQREDVDECRQMGLSRVHWLPLAADPELWAPVAGVDKRAHLGFVGNVWDESRKEVLELLLKIPSLRFLCGRPGAVWKEDAARLLSTCLCGFNVNTLFGSPLAFDVNMRVFETLSCGVPLITNEVPSLALLFGVDAPFIRTYRGQSELPHVIAEALKDEAFLHSGPIAREWIVQHGTYVHRVSEIVRGFGEEVRVA